MTGTLVDSNVILDVATSDSAWAPWSEAALARVARTGPLVINAIVFAEVAVGYDLIEDADEALPADVFIRAAIPYEAAFLASKAFLTYRRRGGRRERTLPDFFVGAHASVAGLRLLTRDARRYRTFFPKLNSSRPKGLMAEKLLEPPRSV